jgi:hypothetical protein
MRTIAKNPEEARVFPCKSLPDWLRRTILTKRSERRERQDIPVPATKKKSQSKDSGFLFTWCLIPVELIVKHTISTILLIFDNLIN